MSPYREPSETGRELPGFGMIGVPSFSLAPFQGPYPECAMCGRTVFDGRKLCLGKRSFWTRTQLCPCNVPHFHPKCESCGHTWLMSPKAGT